MTRRGKPVAKIAALGPSDKIDWPDFYNEVIKVEGKSLGAIVFEGRDDRF